MAVKSEDEQTQSMIAYAQIILDLARRYGGSGWLAYNTHFWAQLFAGKPFKWNEVNPSLLASAFFGNPRLGEGAKTCSRCMAAEHSTAECAVAASEDPKPTVQVTPPLATRQSSARQATLPYPPSRPEEPCRRYNQGICSSRSCRYDHYCKNCYRGAHPATKCKRET